MAPPGVHRGAKLMVSYGGRIERCPRGVERYVGGEHRLVKVSRSASLADLRSRLAAVTGFFSAAFSVRYGISGEGLHALRDVATDDDVRCMLQRALDRDLLIHLLGQDPAKSRRVRVFVARTDAPSMPAENAMAASAVVRRSAMAPPSSLSKVAPPGVHRGAKLMVSYGGRIERCPRGVERYVGGEHRLVKVSRSASLADLRSRLAAVTGFFSAAFSVRYGISGEGLHALRDVATDGDVLCMLQRALDRDLLIHLLGQDPAKCRRVRVFVARTDAPSLPASAVARRSAMAPPSSSSKAAPPPLPPSTRKRVASAPSLSAATSTPSTDNPALCKAARATPPALLRRIATAPSLAQSATTTTDHTASSPATTSHITGTNTPAAYHVATQRCPTCSGPMFLVPPAAAPPEVGAYLIRFEVVRMVTV